MTRGRIANATSLTFFGASVIFSRKGATMKRVTRFGVSIETDLIKRFDRLIRKEGIPNRSEAFRDLIRARIIEYESSDSTTNALGVLSLVYDHHKPDLEDQLTEIQHRHHHEIISTTHVHIDHDRCLEVILLKGTVGRIRAIAKQLSNPKGVQHSKFDITSTEHA
jgi:CopG family nickel-responsive transcriptional regulator